MNTVDLRSIYLIVVIINIVENKRYDINQQCKEEYGLDLEGVLRQFRRSDDYLRILKSRTSEFNDFYMDVIIQALDYNIQHMRTKIETDMGLQEDVATSSSIPTTTAPIARNRYAKKLRSGRRQERDDDSSTDAEQAGNPRNLAKVRRLDTYPRLRSYLSVKERNDYKDLGYTYAGDIIHTVITSFGGHPVDELVRSTRLGIHTPAISTTPHVMKHVATKVRELDTLLGNADESTTEQGSPKMLLRKRNPKFSLVARSFHFGR